MKRSLRALAVLLIMASGALNADVVLEDDAGTTLRLPHPATRVVTLAPHLAELMFEAGAGDRLVGTVEWSNTPDAAKAVPRVGDGFRIDAERVMALAPDVILAWGGGTPENTILQLRELGLRLAVLTPRTLEDIPRQLEWIGELTGTQSTANDVANRFRARLRALQQTYANRSPVDVLYQINDPQVFVIGGKHTITEVIESCGGRNVFADLAAGAHAVSREAVLSRDPDVILIGSHTESLYESAHWQRWPGMRAVKAGNVHVVDAETIARAAPRILEGVEQVCRLLEEARATARDPA